MSNALATTGILIKREGVTVAEIRRIKPPALSRNKLETSTHNDGTESNILGILRQGDAEFDVNWLGDDATHAQILTDLQANAAAAWSIVLPSGITYSASARVSKWEMSDAPVDAVQMANCAIVWAGPITVS